MKKLKKRKKNEQEILSNKNEIENSKKKGKIMTRGRGKNHKRQIRNKAIKSKWIEHNKICISRGIILWRWR